MRTEPAGKQSVAVSILQHITGMHTGGDKRTEHNTAPDIQVGLRVADNNRFTSRTAGGMQTDNILHRYGKQSVGIGVAQIGF